MVNLAVIHCQREFFENFCLHSFREPQSLIFLAQTSLSRSSFPFISALEPLVFSAKMVSCPSITGLFPNSQFSLISFSLQETSATVHGCILDADTSFVSHYHLLRTGTDQYKLSGSYEMFSF